MHKNLRSQLPGKLLFECVSTSSASSSFPVQHVFWVWFKLASQTRIPNFADFEGVGVVAEAELKSLLNALNSPFAE